ncbi:hypothetical protein FOXYS1_8335 [Fusarium oxysporum]|uniref:Xylanolytic transcriptional activator regulatory domain-containing protein n=1 Tax=Fusarium oxysporum TaxID=5507 RepID=A0A8H5EHK9_FUSOX|nr:hypothetical protein FOXYS1_8335 [Fusarium oxysporum]
MRRPVPLLPSPSKPAESQTAAVVAQTEIVLRKRKRPVSSACEEYRKRKSKAENTHFQAVYSLLREKPENIALAILRRIRTGADPDAILSLMENGDLLMQLHLAPSSQFRYAFPYRSALPSIPVGTKSAYMEALALEAPYPGQEPSEPSHACHATPKFAHRNEHWNPQNIGYLFLAEARRLLELETARSKITTVQAMLVMNIIMNDHGVDGASYQYLTKAVALAKRMGLFNSPSDDMEHDVDPSTKVVREVTAWALFAWQGVMSSMLYEPPLITEPPQTSYPDPLEMPFWYSDLRVRYPSSQEVISTSNHQTFKAYLEFWAIFNDIASVSFPPGRDRSFSLSQAVDFYARSRSWFEGLPNDLQPGKIVLPCQLKLHIQYWLLLMDLFKPFADWDQRMEGLDKTSSEIYRDARWNQAYVLRIYYLRHGTEAYDCWFSMFLLKLGFVALQEVASSSDRDASLSNLILALTSLDNQGKCCFMSEFTLRTICAQMRSEDLAIFKQFATFEDLDDPQAIASRMSLIRSNWPVNMDFAKRERKSLRDVAAEAIGMDMTDDE